MILDELRSVAQVITPGDDEWETARHSHAGPSEPDVIVRARSVSDVSAAVRHAVDAGLPVAVRGGGHSAWQSIPGGVLVDLSPLDQIELDGTIVHLGGGATWGAVVSTLAEQRLGISSGDTASVGVGGLTLGGGIGWMVRAWGLAADQLVGVQLVTADGEVLEVSAQSHPELFWALRGGGGNFGIVTRFDFAAHPLPAIVWTTLALDGDKRAVLRRLRDLMRAAPREVTATYMDVPPMDPSAPAGATVSVCVIGDDVEHARRLLAPLIELDGVSVAEIGVKPYRDILLETPAAEPGAPMPSFIGGNILTSDLDDALIDDLASFREEYPMSVLFLRTLGGAYADVAQSDSVFPARDAEFFAMAAVFEIPGMPGPNREVVEQQWEAIEARGHGMYGNFSTSTEPSVAEKVYPPEIYSRLAAVKREWDPQNLFSRNHNVQPA
ncbi:FAD-binding oxidoreductase [Diaminobutyricimonas sp. TR449]|uniref:FAD-binding oxidoreductase n=1 Tax=Diaminobutyricimonas sp. TR449 TaxID=2708076 RepID=UPI00141FBADB|nr:FAD-binding oxidoreductase [Diaminobutyricimonas sp. TR449]